MNAQLPIARISDDEFERLIGKGAAEVLGRVELRDGALHRMNAEYAPHMRMKLALYRAFYDAILASGLALEVGAEGTVSFGQGFSPLPDVFIWVPAPIEKTIPGSAVKLVVEVADMTRTDDLGDKLAEYARAGLPEYWVVDMKARRLHRFAGPRDGGFPPATLFDEGDTAPSVTLEGVAITLAFPA